FLEEAAAPRPARHVAAAHHLERDDAVQAELARTVDDTHAALGDALDELVVAERPALVREALVAPALSALGAHRAAVLPLPARGAAAVRGREAGVAVPAAGTLRLAELEDLHRLRGVEEPVLGQEVLEPHGGVGEGGFELLPLDVTEPDGDARVGGLL